MPRQIAAIVAGTCLPAVLLFLMCAIKGMRRFGALGLWLVGWGLFFAHMKQVVEQHREDGAIPLALLCLRPRRVE